MCAFQHVCTFAYLLILNLLNEINYMDGVCPTINLVHNDFNKNELKLKTNNVKASCNKLCAQTMSESGIVYARAS